MLRFQLSVLLFATGLLGLGAMALAETGESSWYGGRHHGRLTASGERFNENALTAAHRTLPFGTRVKVCRVPAGHPCVTVRITDRGPSARTGRIIDLSKAAAKRIGLLRRGVARVSATVIR